MISYIRLSNFKSHLDSRLGMSPLTIFTGMNGMGKSSVTQSLLMLREGVMADRYHKKLPLSGELFRTGASSAALLNWDAGESDNDRFLLELTAGNGRTVSFCYQ